MAANQNRFRREAQHTPFMDGRSTRAPRLPAAAALIAGIVAAGPAAAAGMPAEIAAPGETAVMTVHAEGAQIYECKAGEGGKLAWAFREPIASLVLDGKTVGRHYAGPNWDHMDGSGVTAKVAGKAPGATAKDIPWLKLAVTANRGDGILTDVTTVQRINTIGGTMSGGCEMAGTLMSIPYSADYVFLRKEVTQ
jgi:hypothetical protein